MGSGWLMVLCEQDGQTKERRGFEHGVTALPKH
jgi:hypothetical protein